MIEGEIDEETRKLEVKFIPVDEKEFTEKEFDTSNIFSEEELIEKLNEEEFEKEKYIKIILIGNRNIEIDSNKILRYMQNPNIIKIKDNTKLKIDLESLAEQNNLKGFFVRNLLEKLGNEPENKEVIEKAIEIGLSSF